VLIPEAAYEEAVVTGKLELYEDAFELEKVLERTSQEARGLDPRAGRMLERSPPGRVSESLHLYHVNKPTRC